MVVPSCSWTFVSRRLDDLHAGVARRLVGEFSADLEDANLVAGNVAHFDLVLLRVRRDARWGDEGVEGKADYQDAGDHRDHRPGRSS